MTKFKMIKEKVLSFLNQVKKGLPFKNHTSQDSEKEDSLDDYLADDLSDFETENIEEPKAPTYQRSKGYHEKAKKLSLIHI